MEASAAVTQPKVRAAGPNVPLIPGRVGHAARTTVLGLEYWAMPGRFIDRCSRLGDRFTLDLPGAGRVTALTNPDDIRVLFTAKPSALSFAKIVKRFLPHHVIFGEDNLVGYDGQKHIKSRRLVSPPLHGEALKGYEAAMVGATQRAMATWRYGETIEFRTVIAPVALDIVMEVVFGITEPRRLDRVRAHILAYLTVLRTKRFFAQTIWATARGGKWDGNYDYLMRARRRIEDDIIEEIEERRRNGAADRPDVLGLFLQARDEDGNPMTDTHILQTLVVLLVAGFETTATTLAWLASETTRKPDVLARLNETVGNSDDSYLDATITETLRVRSPAMITARYLERPLTFDDGLVLEQDTIAMPLIAAIHRRSEIYPDPLRFMPERFLDKAPGAYSWLPFGGGVRRCVGGSFAMLEMRVIMRTILQQARFRAVATPPEEFARANVLVTPSRGGLVTLDPAA